MRRLGLCFLLILTASAFRSQSLSAEEAVIEIDAPLPPPAWALLERELLRANAAACRKFFERYFDERGYLLCVERWGGDDGPDDAIENCNDWPLIHALGGHDDVLRMVKHAWEGHLRQYTEARTTEVPFARDGMYYKEFCVKFDWLHHGEGLTVFNLQGLSDPDDLLLGQRVRRFAGFYMNEDPGAPNYDPQHKIIRSMINGSRGPMLRKATGLDWAGDPIEIENRFHPGHGEENYEQMVAHFKDYNDVAGDNPLNLQATSLAYNAYALSGEKKYRDWLLEYVDAWRDRMEQNGYLIPTNIGLDGAIGGEADGKWYGGVYGWGFSVEVPQDGSTVHRNQHHKGFTGFANAYLLTGDDKYLQPWRRQIDVVNSNAKQIDGRMMYPTMYGDQGWYAYRPQKYNHNALHLYYLSMSAEDRERVGGNRWLAYLEGKNAAYPEQAMRADFSRIRRQVQAIDEDTTTPDTRLADDPMKLNPASVTSLIQLMLGGLHPGKVGAPLTCRLRYFDPERRRAGVPDDVAALVDAMTADRVGVTLVNTNQLQSRTVVVQAGGYGEHQFTSVAVDDGEPRELDANHITVHLAPGAGSRLNLGTRRYANAPVMQMPWNR
ncbi:MAG: hypothetical protein RIC55_08615 [Pirellulaceae bacterium]